MSKNATKQSASDSAREDSSDESIYLKKVPRKTKNVCFNDIDDDRDDLSVPPLYARKNGGDRDGGDSDNEVFVKADTFRKSRSRRASRWGPPVSQTTIADPNALCFSYSDDDSDDESGPPSLLARKYGGDSDDEDDAPIPGINNRTNGSRRTSRWGPPVSEITIADPNAMRYMRIAEEKPLPKSEKKVAKDSKQNSIFVQHLVEGHDGKLSSTKSFRQAYVAKDLTKVGFFFSTVFFVILFRYCLFLFLVDNEKG